MQSPIERGKMKIPHIILTLFIVQSMQFSGTIEIPLNGKVADLFCCLRNIIKGGMPFLPASMDPYKVEYTVWTSEKPWLSGTYEFMLLTFTGLSKFSVRSLDFYDIPEKQEFQLNCKMACNLKLVSDYRISNGNLFAVTAIQGDGHLTVRTSPVELDLTMNFDSKCSDRLCFKNAHLGVRMNSYVNITGLGPNERMSSLISRQLASIIDDLFKPNAKIVDAFIDPILTELIATFTSVNVHPELKPFLEAYLRIVWDSCRKNFLDVGNMLIEQINHFP